MGSLIEQVGRLEARVSVLQTEQARGQFAAFVPGDPRSQYMRANVGPMAVSIGELARAGNDARVQVRLGNLTSADVGECTVSVSWGGRAGVDAKGRPLGSAATPATRRRTATVTEPLRAGYWTPTSVTLPNSRPSDIAYVRLDQLECQSVTLD